MKMKEFSEIRHQLGKTQAQMSQLLCISLQAIKSFEQGWRKIPINIERQTLFLLASKKAQSKRQKSCWALKKCSLKTRRNCPAWEFKIGHLCWFINGTICRGEKQEGWQEKIKMCRQCGVFMSIFDPDHGYDADAKNLVSSS